jgi:hypothetical protein
VAYTAGKQIDNVQERFGGRSSFIDPNNLSLSRSIGEFDRPQYITINHIYELPVGPGKRFAGRGPVASVVGRWQISGITTFGKGLPLVITCRVTRRLPGVSAAAVRLRDPVLDASARTLDRYFDTSAFQPAPTYSMGNDSRTQPRLRGPGISTFIVAQPRADHPRARQYSVPRRVVRGVQPSAVQRAGDERDGHQLRTDYRSGREPGRCSWVCGCRF